MAPIMPSKKTAFLLPWFQRSKKNKDGEDFFLMEHLWAAKNAHGFKRLCSTNQSNTGVQINRSTNFFFRFTFHTRCQHLKCFFLNNIQCPFFKKKNEISWFCIRKDYGRWKEKYHTWLFEQSLLFFFFFLTTGNNLRERMVYYGKPLQLHRWNKRDWRAALMLLYYTFVCC